MKQFYRIYRLYQSFFISLPIFFFLIHINTGEMYSLASCTKLYTVHTETKITESNKESYPASHSETPPRAPSLAIQTHIFIFFFFVLSHGSRSRTSCQNGSGVSRDLLTSSTQTFNPTVMKVALVSLTTKSLWPR